MRERNYLRTIGPRLLAVIFTAVIVFATVAGPSLGRACIGLAVAAACFLGMAVHPLIGLAVFFLPYHIAGLAGDIFARWVGFIIVGLGSLVASPRVVELISVRWRALVATRRSSARRRRALVSTQGSSARLRTVEDSRKLTDTRIRLASSKRQRSKLQATIEELVGPDPSNLGSLVAYLAAKARDLSGAAIEQRLGDIAGETERAEEMGRQLRAELGDIQGKRKKFERQLAEAERALTRLRDQDPGNVEVRIRRLSEGREDWAGDEVTDGGEVDPIAEAVNRVKLMQNRMGATEVEVGDLEERLKRLSLDGIKLRLERCVLERENVERKLSDLSELEFELTQCDAERTRLREELSRASNGRGGRR